MDVLPDMLDLNVLRTPVLVAPRDKRVVMIPTHIPSGGSDRHARFKYLLDFCAVGLHLRRICSYRVLSYRVLCCPIWYGLVLSCLIAPCLVVSDIVLSYTVSDLV